MKLMLRIVREMNRPGQMTNQGFCVIKSLFSKSNRPQVGTLEGKPSPRKDKADSVRIADATPRVAETIMGLRTLGKMCRNRIKCSQVPTLTAASTNSFSLTDSTDPRTTRAVGIHPKMPITTTTRRKIPSSGPSKVFRASRNSIMITRSSGRLGKASIRSVNRMRGLSSRRK